ncbi:hypothetical protein ACFSTE_19620 [Aquimarina hainanensis]|uniref:Uncharacterized protein n=1 Tax=Aquimarina hainanensis TaxID=1578017 RepID=A0ABW5NDX6_9FLAO
MTQVNNIIKANSKQKTILTIWNTGEKGKTESLRQFSNLLLTTFPTYIPIYPIPSNIPISNDFRLVIEIEGVIIGIESQGDPNTNLHDRLVGLVTTYNCDIIICASRTRGKTVAAVQNIRNTYGFQVIWTSTYQIDDRTQYELINRLKGKHILDLLKSLGLL